MVVVYPDLDLSKVVIDDTIPPTLVGADVANDEIDDSIHIIEDEVKDLNAEVVVQSASEGSSTPKGLSAIDGPSTMNQPLSDAPPS